MSITRAILSPADRIAWLAVLRAPFCGLSLRDLVLLTNIKENTNKEPQCILQTLYEWQQNPTKFTDLTQEGSEILFRVTPLLLMAWEQRNTDNLRNHVEQLWIELGGAATLINQRDIHDIRRYLDLLESLAASWDH